MGPITTYSNTLLKDMNDSGSLAITPTQGTSILGIAAVLGSSLGTITNIFFGRKPILVFG